MKEARAVFAVVSVGSYPLLCNDYHSVLLTLSYLSSPCVAVIGTLQSLPMLADGSGLCIGTVFPLRKYEIGEQSALGIKRV